MTLSRERGTGITRRFPSAALLTSRCDRRNRLCESNVRSQHQSLAETQIVIEKIAATKALDHLSGCRTPDPLSQPRSLSPPPRATVSASIVLRSRTQNSRPTSRTTVSRKKNAALHNTEAVITVK